jgi:signal transduction histidine kinase
VGKETPVGAAKQIPVGRGETALLPVVEVARLEALRRLSMGAAHALNNAFTAVVGEASFLREERKGDAAVVEACDTILRELDRCAKLTRALLARRHPPQAGRDEVDLVRTVRDLAPLLRETLGRQKELTVQLPDDLLLVRGEAAALELLVLLLVHQGADVAPGSARLRLAAVSAGARARLELEIEADDLADDAGRAFAEPASAGDSLARNQLGALAELARRHGGTCSARREGACRLLAAVELPALGHA